MMGEREPGSGMECGSCGFINAIEPSEPIVAPASGSTGFVPKASPTCARCQKVLSTHGRYPSKRL